MNARERLMLEILEQGRVRYGFHALKTEFEAEGARIEEVCWLSGLARRAGLKLGVKIGGCEAVTDLYTCRQFAAEYIIAPMVETPYALQKYIDAKNKVFDADEQGDIGFLFNVETITAYDNRAEMMRVATQAGGVAGVVFGRVDFAGSTGMGREAIGLSKVGEYVREMAVLCREHGLDLVVGGGVSTETLGSLQEARRTYLTRFETRKVIFSAEALDGPDIVAGLSAAVHFELLWLQNKCAQYGRMSDEDASRLHMLERRWSDLNIQLKAS
jgi:hypothetical protein